jgi:hypothetical protein
MISLCKGNNPIYSGVIRSKVKVTVVECHKIANLKGLNFPAHMISCLTELPLYRLIIYIDGRIL